MRHLPILPIATILALSPVAGQTTLEEDIRQLERMSDTFATVSARVQAGVVAVSTERIIATASPFRGMPFDDPIFRRFFRMGVELQRKKPGTGLGLYIVHILVRRMKGRIRVRDRDDGPGTMFEITLRGQPTTSQAEAN